jgi:hypothetical protein
MIRNTKQFSLLILCRNEQTARAASFSRLFPFVEPKIWQGDSGPTRAKNYLPA